MITFALIATLELNNTDESWVLDYNLTKYDCQMAMLEFSQSNIFVRGVTFTCEIEE